MTSVRTVATRRPPITVIAIGARSSLPSPSPTAIGKSPSTVVDVVMRIGRNRSFPASFKAAMVSTRTLASAEKEGWGERAPRVFGWKVGGNCARALASNRPVAFGYGGIAVMLV